MLLYSIVGGTPAYRDGAAGGRGPQSVADLDPWVAENVLSRFSPLFRDARYLLAEEPDIRDNAVYHSVLSAVAEGNGTRGGNAGYRRCVPPRPQRAPDQRAADCLLPRDHAA